MKRILILIVCIAALTSCATTRYYSGFTNSQVAQGMALLGPASTIFFIDKDNSEYYDESMSAASDMLVGRIAGEMGLPISGTMALDSLQREEAVGFMQYLAGANMTRVDAAPMPVVRVPRMVGI